MSILFLLFVSALNILFFGLTFYVALMNAPRSQLGAARWLFFMFVFQVIALVILIAD